MSIDQPKSRVRRNTEIILRTAIGGVILGTFVVMPQISALIPVIQKIFGKEDYDTSYNKARTLSRLIKSGKIRLVTKDNKRRFEITDEGKRMLGRARTIKKVPTHWDGKWRLVSFDVYEKLRSRRDAFRMQLKEYGFVKVQQSLWVYPYPCEEFITLLRTDMRFGKNIRYIVAIKIDNDTDLKEIFEL